MDFFNLIEQRRSIRKYKNQPVEPEKVDKIVEAALRAPSSRNLQPSEFIVVTEQVIITRLAQARPHGSTFLRKAPAAIVACADPEKCDVWIENASIAATYIFLAAEALGLGCCWIQIRERIHNEQKTAEEFVREVLNIPNSLKVEAIIAFGYPDEHKPGHAREELPFAKVFTNAYGVRTD
ncbi:MAG: NAD(P)H-dependent dehydrogenase/reductase [Firmicutes bacterium]|nr:NAD(P)H-dependent dehydrogenase/reductase [Bacillota bacterium]